MTKSLVVKRARAVELRKRGWSYPKIKQELQVSKSSLSLWLRHLPLTEEQIQSLKPEREARRIEHFRQTFAKKRQASLDEYYQEEFSRLLPLSSREVEIAGLMLYWGEGLKASWSRVEFSNTNPAMIKFAIYWLTNCCHIPKERLSVRFHFYSDMNINQEHNYWSDILDIPVAQFRKPYIKQSLRSTITEKGGFGHGTCDLGVDDTKLKERIMMAIKVIADQFS